MTQQHLDDFIADLRTINPAIRIDNWFGASTPLMPLITHLRQTVNAPVLMTVYDARRMCGSAFALDPHIAQYTPAIQRLVSVWGRGAHLQYPRADTFVPTLDFVLRSRARQNFNNLVQTVPVPYQPAYNDLLQHEADTWAFSRALGPGYLHRIALGEGRGNLDITARSLFLRAGLAIPDHISWDNGYMSQLQLVPADLDRMAGASILDVGCGAAIFRAEMETLYGSVTTGVDLNPGNIAPAINEGKRRYAKSMLYLKMLSDMNVLIRTNVDLTLVGLLENCVRHLPTILENYSDNPPRQGDVFNLAAAARAYRPLGWDYTVSMYLLCYFNADDQTEAVLNMCSVTRRAVFLFSGLGSVLTDHLAYDQDQVRQAYPGCRIVVKSNRTHHIFLR